MIWLRATVQHSRIRPRLDTFLKENLFTWESTLHRKSNFVFLNICQIPYNSQWEVNRKVCNSNGRLAFREMRHCVIEHPMPVSRHAFSNSPVAHTQHLQQLLSRRHPPAQAAAPKPVSRLTRCPGTSGTVSEACRGTCAAPGAAPPQGATLHGLPDRMLPNAAGFKP